jgi:hypothetical protein
MVRKNFSGRTSTENGDSALRNSQSCWNFPKREFIHDRIACLSKILQAIIDKEGGQTKY